MNHLSVISPVDSQVYVERPYADATQIANALEKANQAILAWRGWSIEQRSELVNRAVDIFVSMEAELSLELTWQMGRPIRFAPGEIAGFEERARHMAAIAPEALRPIRPEPKDGFNRFIHRDPVGQVLVIAPWNYPYLTAVNVVVPALLSGNTVILKHSAQTPLCAERFKDRHLLVNILQSRDSVADPESWVRRVESIIWAFLPLTVEFQIGNAVNRSKWGCRHTGEYLDLLEGITDLRHRIPELVLAGSSVIDFEPLATLRTLVNGHRYHLDACSCALYVNRRGSPYSTQYGVFDLARKIRLIHAITLASNRSDNRLWITETNWPLLNTKPYTPNSGLPRSTVDEETQASYLSDYYRIAYASGRVERVYWWQLVNPGYGLIDHRDNQMRKMPSFHAFARLLNTDVLHK